MSNFLNQSPEKSKKLHEPIYKNAQKLKKDALLIANQNKSYSTASSLLILSSEEIIKAMLVLLHSEGYSVYRIKDAKKFFSDHKIRHELAKMLEIINGFIESGLEYEKNEKSKLQKFKNETFNEVFNLLIDLKNAAKPFIKTGVRIKLLEQFNENKNKGFYTDFRDSLLIPKDIINETIFLESKELVERIFKTYKVLKIMYHPKVNQHLKNENITKYKNDIRDVVNGLIQGVEEFKKLK
ncbi:conserved hypothetical protein [Flavobacterium sp. 9AF]|uniref:AbiV family abortive infection protein n=1 Tax=Flavobacterium sp. 9AF TaxID=2653142 RepID=UPI0012F0A0C0|nr:AbiV family abortive infection protein [Flavobacterium sp. 9AF]VXA97914.1 conserved hypothetical protein [Flavobacterium sp. 9AF]